jgi:hypothetical protein
MVERSVSMKRTARTRPAINPFLRHLGPGKQGVAPQDRGGIPGGLLGRMADGARCHMSDHFGTRPTTNPQRHPDAHRPERRTPPYDPDAVTLVANPRIPNLLSQLDNSAGCTIKDSYASLDLSEHGFRVLFDAQWIVRPPVLQSPAPSAGPQWEVVLDAPSLAAWGEAWRGDNGPANLFRLELLDHPSVVVLAARSLGRVVAGAIVNRSASVVGISNLFAGSGITSTTWSRCIALVASLFPASTFVGYESGAELAAALLNDFEQVGPLRVWIREN